MQILVSGLIFIFFGCAPEIIKINVTKIDGQQPAHGQPTQVEAYITQRYGGADTPTMKIKPYAPSNEPYTDAGTLPNKVSTGPINIPVDGTTLQFNGYRYYGDMSKTLEYGGYILRLGVTYFDWFHTYEAVATTNFLVDAPSTCFSFDGGLQGFRVENVCNGLGGNAMVCHDLSIGWDHTNWPFDYLQPNQYGTATVQITLPKFIFETPYWIADFISPSLENRSEWQSARGVTFRLATHAAGSYAQPLFKVRDNSGNIKWWAPKDANNSFLVYPISEPSTIAWKAIEWVPTPTFEGVILELHIRIYGDESTVTNNRDMMIYLDGVCPKPPGITPTGAEVVTPVPNPWQ